MATPIPPVVGLEATATPEKEALRMGNVVEMFEAIKNFVSALWEVYPEKRVTPLLLYSRFLDQIKLSHASAMNRICEGFVKFFRTVVSQTKRGADITVDDLLVSGQLSKIPRDSCITFSDTIYIPIQKYIYLSKQTDEDVLTNIHIHLLTISSMMTPSKAKIGKLEKLGAKVSPEMEFIKTMMGTVEKSVKGIDKSSNPTAAVAQLLASGKLMSIMGDMERNVKKNKLDLPKLFTAMSGYMGAGEEEAEGADGENEEENAN